MISRKDMMLKPRQRPNRPPREATKSTGPILILLSNSSELEMENCHKIFLTHDSVLAKEDVDNSNVLLPSVVEVVLKNQTFCSSRFYH